MKKTLAFILALMLAFALAGCGGETGNTPSASPTESSQAEPTPSPEAPEVTPEPQQDATPFEKFSDGLDKLGYKYESTVMGAELVGAKSGQKYTFDFGKIEIYQFEDGSEALEKAVSDGGVTLEGFGVFPCEFNGNLAAIVELSENEEAILNLFNSL